MNVVIVYKWARDEANALVRADGSVDWRNAKMTAGEDDPAALAVARTLAETAGGSLAGLTIGDGDASWALARGVEQAVRVSDVPDLVDNAATAAVLAAAVRRIGAVDVVVIGDSTQNPGVCVALAGQLGWPVVAGLTSATAVGDRVEAVRCIGTRELTFSMATPVVLGVLAQSDVDRPPGMKELLAARRRPLTTWALADLAEPPVDVVSRGTRAPDVPPARIFDGAPTVAAEQLVAALRDAGALA